MGARSVLPGLLSIIAAVVLLALVSFNTPSSKQLYFLEAKFEDYILKSGTLGYCLDTAGKVTCQGPQVGYEFDLNKVLNSQNAPFNIPTAVSKYSTYVLIIHIISLGFAVSALSTGLMELIPGCVMMCFPTCSAGIAGGSASIVFIFDVAIFYIARARINSVQGASASIGAAVWMTLAAWSCCCFAGCAYGMGRACCWDSGERGGTRRRTRRERQEEEAAYRRDEASRMQAIRDDKSRQHEQDSPNFATYERQPLTSDVDDKYYYEETGNTVPALPHDGHGIQGVGVGYGRRTGNANVQRQPSVGSTFTAAGAAGVGAGGAGVEVPNRYEGYAAYQVPQTQQYTTDNYNRAGYEQTYNDPYAYNGSGNAAYNYDNTPQGYGNAYDQAHNNYYAGAAGAGAGAAAGASTAAAVAGTRNRLAPSNGHGQERGNRTSFHSSDNYHDPTARVHPAEAAYDYGDDYEAIGRAATSPSDPRYRTPPAPPPKSAAQRAAQHQSLESQYTQYTQPTTTMYAPAPTPSVPPPAQGHGHGHRKEGSTTSAGTMKVPQPQPSGQFFVANRTTSPVSEYPQTEFSRDSEYTTTDISGRPPSYGQVAQQQANVYPGDQKRPF